MSRKYNLTVFLLVTTVLGLSIVVAHNGIDHTKDVNNFIADVNERINKTVKEQEDLEDELLDFDSQTQERQKEIKNLLEHRKNVYENIELQRKSYISQPNLDAKTKQALEQINIGGAILIGADLLHLMKNVDKMQEIIKGENGTLYEYTEGLCNIQLDDLKKTNENWKSFHDKLGAQADEFIFKNIEIIKRHAKKVESDPVSFWFSETTLDDLSEIDQVMIKLKPFYAQVHAYVRQKLKDRFGDKVISESGRIPEHLYKNLQLNIWNDETYSPSDDSKSSSKEYQKILEDLEYNSATLVKLAEEFFVSLGLDELGNQTWSRNIWETEDSMNVFPALLYGYGVNYSLYINDRTDIEALGVHHSYVLGLYGSILDRELPIYFQDDYELQTALGDAVKLSVLSRNHLKNVELTTDAESDDIVLDINTRLAISSLFNIMYGYVELKILTGLFNGNISKSELNTKYWQMMAEYAGVEAPVARESNSLDLPYSFYSNTNDNSDISKLFANNILMYQFYKAFCDKIGHKGPLTDCDFYGEKDIGDLLKQILSLGTSKPYEEILGLILKDNQKMNIQPMLEYYKPIQTYLDKQKLKTGWKEEL